MTQAHILVVEDESIVALDIKNRLESLGYAMPALVSSGEEAINKAAEMRPDLVLMDVRLKGEMDGVEAAEQIRARFEIPVVYLTAYADEATLQRAKITEPLGYVIKPFEERELSAAIEMALYRHKMERRLRESERWLSATLKSVGDAVIATDGRGRIAFINPVAEALTGWKQEEALGQDVNAVFHIMDEETHTVTENPILQALREGVVVSLGNHTILIAKDGTETPIDDSAAPIKDDNGSITGVVLVFRDVTKRRQAEDALRRSLAETARGRRLLLALGQAAQAVQRARTPEEVYQTIGDEIARLGYQATVFTLTDDRAHLVVAHLAFEPAMLRAAEKLTGLSAQDYRVPLVPGGFYQRIVAGGETVFSDPDAGPILEALPGPVRPLAGRLAAVLGVGQAIYAPLKVSGEPYGLLTVIGTDLTEADVSAVSAFASQAAVAVENARLYEEARQRALEQETLREAAMAMTTALERDVVVERILAQLQRVVPYDTASVQLLKGDRLEIVGGHGFPNLPEIVGLSFPVDGDNPNREVIRTRAPFIVEDGPAVYEEFRHEPHAPAGIRSWLGVPMLVGERLIGMIALDKTVPGFYTQERARLAEAFAAQAAIAIENTRLF